MPDRDKKKSRGHLAPPSAIDLQLPVTECKGVGPKIASLLANLDILTVEDMLHHFPRFHLDRRKVIPIESVRAAQPVVIMGVVTAITGWRPARRLHITQCSVRDGTGTIKAVWFNQPYMIKSISKGGKLILSGTASNHKGLQLENPDIEVLEDDKREFLHTMALIPVYPLTNGIGQKTMRRLVRAALDDYLDSIPESLPHRIIHSRRLLPKRQALRSIHFPEDDAKLQQARRTLAFEEFAALQVNLLSQAKQAGGGIAFTAPTSLTKLLDDHLPFTLTSAQTRAKENIFHRMESPERMNVLLQGDVGSGKTIVATYAMLKALENRKQAALMVPTEVLSEQHFLSLQPLMRRLGVQVCLLNAGSSIQDKQEILKMIASGRPCLVIGTHALLSESVIMPNLGLAVIDEQHRFGVNQRAALSNKGVNPDLLIMTATPIPRTLALTLYSDFDTIAVDQYPEGRAHVDTASVTESERPRIIDVAQVQLRQGRQIFIICPEIGETPSGKDEKRTTVRAAFKSYSKIFSEWEVAFLHGKMDLEQRKTVIERFRDNRIQVLISTTVIEVGVDMPNASVIIIEGADRFGLTQLHQLRGRVGRSTHKSYCFLIADSPTIQAEQRLAVLETTSDGFQLAEQDLLLRGPGEFLGSAQSGLPKLRVGHLLRDAALLQETRREIAAILKDDPLLESAGNRPLRNFLKSGSSPIHL